MDNTIIKLCGFLGKILSLMHRGSSLPGQLALKYNKNILKNLSRKYKVILVTGTNGKTTTSSLITKILRDSGHSVISNFSGANLLSGITTAFIKNEKIKNKEFAVIEIDEANLPLYTQVAAADYILCTNIFKDQLDRYGEIYTTIKKIEEGIENSPEAKIILNGDEPLFGNIKGSAVYYGFHEATKENFVEERYNVEGQLCKKCGHKYSYEFTTYNHLGKYECEKCGYKRPELDYSASGVKLVGDNHIEFEVNNKIRLGANLSGMYSVYNVLAACTVAKEAGVCDEDIVKSVGSFKSAFGRNESFEHNGKNFRIFLVKNPAGFNQSIRIPNFNGEDSCALFILNDNAQDGKDISWIWDVDFENARSEYKKVFTAGKRKYDMAIRLKIAGYGDEVIEIINSTEEFIEKLDSDCKCKNVYIFANYTAMIDFRMDLARKNIIKYSW